MAKIIKQASEQDYLKLWEAYVEGFKKYACVRKESHVQKIKRIKHLEAHPDQWFKEYFPSFYKYSPAPFHIESTGRVLNNPEWFEVRAWSRELAKSARTMMEVCYLMALKKKKNMLLVSNSKNNAERLLLPYKVFFESNPRYISDYSRQQRIGSWTSSEFITKEGAAFRALGWGESPRGTRNENVRPDLIIIDDIDTDEECRNQDIMTRKINWIEQALIPTRSISEPLLLIVNGNIIHENCIVNKLKEKSDYFSLVNIQDAKGNSTWPSKNSQQDIDRVLNSISYESAQKEYFNNPMDHTVTFKNIQFKKTPDLKSCDLCIYCDPSTSNRDNGSGSDKAIVLLAKHHLDYYVVRAFLDTMNISSFIDSIFELYTYGLKSSGKEIPVYIENNSLQNPFFEGLLLPEIYRQIEQKGVFLPIIPDATTKENKYSRIELTLEPLVRLGHFYLNEDQKENLHMAKLHAQFKAAHPKLKKLDGLDACQGAVEKLKQRAMIQGVRDIEFFQSIPSKRL